MKKISAFQIRRFLQKYINDKRMIIQWNNNINGKKKAKFSEISVMTSEVPALKIGQWQFVNPY